MPEPPKGRDKAKERARASRPILDEEVPYLEDLGAAVRHERQARGLTMVALAEASLLKRRHFDQIEHGTRRTRRSTLERIAQALAVAGGDADELLARFVALAGPTLAQENPYAARTVARKVRRAERLERLMGTPEVQALIEERAKVVADELIYERNRAWRTYYGKRLYSRRAS